MTDILLPPGIVPQSMALGAQYLGGVFRSDFSPAVQTISRPGGLIQGRVLYRNKANISSAPHRDLLTSAVMDMRGVESRVLIRDYSNILRGSFPAAEVFTSNTTFESGITGWTDVTTGDTDVDQDGYFMRITDRDSVSRLLPITTPAHTIVANVPYAVRCFHRRAVVNPIRIRLAVGADVSTAEDLVNVGMTESGLFTRWFLDNDTTVFPHLETWASAAQSPTGFAFIGLFSVSRCILVDNRGNQITRSEELDHADWVKTRASITPNDIVSPAFQTTADKLVEDTAVNNTHEVATVSVTKGSVSEDWCWSIFIKADERFRGFIRLHEVATQSNRVDGNFNLTAETITPTAAGTWANARAFIKNLGSGWFRLSVIGTTSTVTTIRGTVIMQDATGDATYTGDGSSGLHPWGGQITQSSVPVEYQSTIGAVASEDVQTGSEIRVKGLPVSTKGLLLPGDRVDLNLADTSTNDKDDLQFLICTAGLDSDAMGIGILHVEPGLRAAPVDNAPIVVLNPMIRAVSMSQNPQWTHRRPGFADFEIPFLEAAA